MATKKAAKRPSGPSGQNKQRSTIIREDEPGQIEEWYAAAKADGRTFASWVRFTLNNAAAKWRRSKQ